MQTSNSTLALDPARRHESRAYQLTTAVIVCPIFAAILTALRIYTRLVLIKQHFWEDFIIVVAMVCSVIMSVSNQLAVLYGSGRHFETITRTEFVEFLKVGIAIAQLYSLCHLFLKLSILLQYVRISVMPSERRLCQALIALLCTGYITFILLRMVRCIPFAAQWDRGIPGARCFFNTTWFFFASQAWNMVMDFVILVLPLYLLRHSNAPLIQRVLIGIVLAFGGSACVVSALRLRTLHPSTTSADPSWDKVPSAIYALIEINVGICCASVVTLRPLFYRLRQPFSNVSSSRQTQISLPQDPVRRRRRSNDLVLETGCTTRTDSEGHAVELGGMARIHSGFSSSVTESTHKTGEPDA
ncbi:Rhodopsin domain-containing protein [Madurella fahalii]|uniref:Rhodopsin domain-containing protein n=1 Tax=Madurella fahalii TaxID=1157608 RepID=A0ABQ0GD97_9PEZI